MTTKQIERWQIKVEPWCGWSFAADGGKFHNISEASLVKYRTAGTRGRWRRVVVQGALPPDLQSMVSTYESNLRRAGAKS